ncbi:hypothetical protein LAZ67_13000908 [Cordylochernes scorpioides]|uniref:CCHC-type domain-containing protein n=1 Tax=Cordylochernes scorpioides TaxID=51811 RepID=A0ABY6L3E2_9ARAC|nr:hypothetical protein LAZ67_13000908 [Cordylochernes scorpioides]
MFKDEDTQDAQLKAQKDRALAVIALSINTEHQIHIIDCSSPQDAWKNLEQFFEPKSRSRILQLKKQFVNIKLQTGLPDSFDTLVMSFGNVEDSDFTSNKVRNTLLTEYERRSAREGASSGLGEALNFSKDGTRKTSRKQGVKCYRCSKIGHIAKDCRSSINRDYKADKSYSRKKDSFKSPSENMLMAFNAVSSEDEFILDSGATHHVCKNRQWFTSFQPTMCEPIQTASGNLQVEGVENIHMKMYLDTGTQDVTLNDVLIVPQARRNLLSVSQAEEKGKHIKICNHKARVFNDNRVICVARNLNGLYIVRGYDSQLEVPSTSEVRDIVGGSSENTLSLRSREIERKTLNLANVELNLCEVSEPQTFEEAVCSPESDLSKNAMQEELNCLEERRTWVITNLPKNKKVIGNRWVFKIKGDSKGKVSKFKARLVAKGYSQTPEIDFNQTYDPAIILSKIDCPHTQAEIDQIYLFCYFETFPICANPGKKHWEAAKHVLRYLSGTIDLELSYVKGNNNKVAMFTDAYYGSDTDDRRSYSGMVAVIDGNVINWRSKKQQCVSLSTMESEYIALCHSAKEAVWLGQTLSDLGFISHFAKPLTIYCDNRSAIDFSKNNIENNRSKHISVQFHYTRDKINSGDIIVQFVNTKENLADIQTKTLKKLMHRDACFQMNLKSQEDEQLDNHVLSDVDIEEPAPDTMINRQTESSESDRPQRTRTIPKRFDDYVLATTNETIPKDYEEAIACEDKKHWENAMLEEIQNMYSHQVWELVPRPVNAKVVKSKWVFKISKDQENKTYKARLVAMGYNQIPGRDYNESFSPVIKNATLRTILSIAATKDSVIKLFDVKAAYLNGNIENTIFMEQPAGFVQDRNKVCKLNKSIYGLPQSGRSWYEKFSQVLHDCGLEKLKSDPCLFKWKNEDKYFYVGIYVDDFITVSDSEDTSNRFINKLRHHLEIKDVTCKGMFLGIKIIQDKEGISLQQSHYVQQILQKYGLENCKEVPTPGSKEINLDNHIEDDNCDQHTYQEALGMLMFLAVNTRPDIAYITSKLSQYSRQPKQMHWTAIKRVMRYLRGTIDLGVKFERGKTGILKSYADASWSTTHDGKSYGGYVLKLGEATIDWKSSKQPLVALSTMEAEMIAACESCCQIKWIINLLRELEEWNFMEKPTAIYTDSQSLINWISSPKQSSRCRHINRKYHFLRDCYESRDICLLYKPSQDLEADIFTKDLSRDQMKKHLESLSIVGIKPK